MERLRATSQEVVHPEEFRDLDGLILKYNFLNHSVLYRTNLNNNKFEMDWMRPTIL